MKKILNFLCISMIIVFSSCAQKVSLFNGKDLAGWKVYGTEKWYVENGELICESGPDAQYGYLATEKTYKDFDLTVDFLQEANGNSGVFFRSTIDGADGHADGLLSSKQAANGSLPRCAVGAALLPGADGENPKPGDRSLAAVV